MSGMYDKGREAFAAAQINWTGDTIEAILVDAAAYTPDLANHQYLSSIPAGARVGSAVALTAKTNVGGVLGAANISFTNLVAAPSVEMIVIYKRASANDATCQLICMIDQTSNASLPVAAGATQIDVAWDTGANKILKI